MSEQRSQPWDFAQAMSNSNAIRAAQAQAEDFYKRCARDFAEKEERYRVSLASEIVRQHNDEKVAWSVAPDLARGDKDVARLRRERDIAEGMKDAALQALWRISADRRDLGRFIDWSMRVDIAVHVHDQDPGEPEPTEVQTFGRRAA
jgi:hypothetical protein